MTFPCHNLYQSLKMFLKQRGDQVAVTPYCSAFGIQEMSLLLDKYCEVLRPFLVHLYKAQGQLAGSLTDFYSKQFLHSKQFSLGIFDGQTDMVWQFGMFKHNQKDLPLTSIMYDWKLGI